MPKCPCNGVPFCGLALPGDQLSPRARAAPGLSMEPAHEDVCSSQHKAHGYWAKDAADFLSSWLAFKPGKRRNIFRLIPILFSHLVLCCWSLPCLRRRPRSALCGIFPSARLVSAFILGAMPAPSSPLIPGPEEKTGLGNVLSSPPPPPPPQGPSALSHCGADGARRSKPNRLFLARGGMHNASCAASCRQLEQSVPLLSVTRDSHPWRRLGD